MEKTIIIAFIMFLLLLKSLTGRSQLRPDNSVVVEKYAQQRPALFTRQRVTTSVFNIHYTRLQFSLDPAVRALQGIATHHFMVQETTDTLVLLLAPELTPDSILFHNTPIDFSHDGYLLTLRFPRALLPAVSYSTQIWYGGVPPDNGYFLQDEHEGVPVLATFAEPYGASDWWPVPEGMADKIDSLDMELTFPVGYESGANGLNVETQKHKNGTITQFWQHRYPIVPYNVAFAVSVYEKFTQEVVIGTMHFSIENLAYAEDLSIAQATTASLPEAISLFSSLFGPYPFQEEKYGHMQWNRGGAMEHQTMTSTGSWDYELLVHELAHQWFGNMVTTASWHDIFLNEGFATYLSGLAYEYLFPETDFWTIWKTQKRAHILTQPGGSVYVSDTTDVARIFDARLSYNKGAMVLHMLRSVIGDSAFFQGINNYLYHPEVWHGFAGMDHFIESMEEVADTSLGSFFNDWYYGEGYPSYTIRYTPGCNALFEISLYQETSHPAVDFFEMPVTLLLKNEYADTLITLKHTYNGQYFLIPLEFCVEEIIFDPAISLVTDTPTFISGIGGPSHEKQITLFPNPTGDFLTIKHENTDFQLLNICSIAGIQALTPPINTKNSETIIDVRTLQPGVYILTSLVGKQPTKKKFIIK
ncbi:MAG: M1 family aminopeptidase [Bacteroidales bacterium]|nr:M1 family aminopeptidase [Bacteroidales bacterium]